MLRWFPKKMLFKKAVTGGFVVALIVFVNFFLIKRIKLYDVPVPGVFNINGEKIHKLDFAPSTDTAAVVDPDRSKFSEERLLSIRYWDLANSSSRGSLSRRAALPNLWRPQRGNLSRDDDRVLAQLVWAMEFKETPKTSLSMNIPNAPNAKVQPIHIV